jgi:hypothetical protein
MADYKFYAGVFATDFEEIGRAAAKFLESPSRGGHWFAIVLAHPGRPFVKANILPMISYWHYRSAESMLFVFPGFQGDVSQIGDDFKTVTGDDFDDAAFTEVLNRIEANLGHQ